MARKLIALVALLFGTNCGGLAVIAEAGGRALCGMGLVRDCGVNGGGIVSGDGPFLLPNANAAGGDEREKQSPSTSRATRRARTTSSGVGAYSGVARRLPRARRSRARRPSGRARDAREETRAVDDRGGVARARESVGIVARGDAARAGRRRRGMAWDVLGDSLMSHRPSNEW